MVLTTVHTCIYTAFSISSQTALASNLNPEENDNFHTNKNLLLPCTRRHINFCIMFIPPHHFLSSCIYIACHIHFRNMQTNAFGAISNEHDLLTFGTFGGGLPDFRESQDLYKRERTDPHLHLHSSTLPSHPPQSQTPASRIRHTTFTSTHRHVPYRRRLVRSVRPCLGSAHGSLPWSTAGAHRRGICLPRYACRCRPCLPRYGSASHCSSNSSAFLRCGSCP